jgi:plastocyanin
MRTEISRTRYMILGTAILLAVLIAGCTGTAPQHPVTPTVTPAATTAPVTTAAMTMVMTTSPPTAAQSPAAPTAAPTTEATIPTTIIQTPAAPPGVAVVIQNFGFNPQVIAVPVGTTVTWTNLDSVQHQVANSATGMSGPGQIFQSKILGKGDTYSYTFNTAGSYRYYCVIHPYMWGIVNVA